MKGTMKMNVNKPINQVMKTKFYSHMLFRILGIVFLISGCQSDNKSSQDITETGNHKHQLYVDYNNVIAPIQPTMYGIFFEDINFAADGGIYAELIKNRSFEFTEPLMGWDQPESDRFSMNDKSGFAIAINRGDDLPNSRFLRIEVKSKEGYEIINSGFRGMGFKEGNQYNFTTEARLLNGNLKIHLELLDSAENVIGSASIEPNTENWSTYNAKLTSEKTVYKGKFRLRFEGIGELDLDMVSLFPEDTWKGREKGMRQDLVQLLDDLNPGFLRFPGGCIVEGRTLARRYQWKKTVGDIATRDLLINRWNTEFDHRLTPDYFQSFGLGFFEYFQLAEDMGAEPLPILGCGIACQFNTGELVPMDELGPYVQDALDLIEFANGAVDTDWGKIRADMGHPEPFNMKYLGIGNEQWGPQYIERYKEFEKAIKARYPEIIIVSGSGPYPDGEMFEYGWKELKKLNAEIIDEHYYRNPEWFYANADRYDSYDRNGPKVFAGEYAAQSVAIASPDNKNNWNCALSEAAFMTGLERNADVVYMTSYAPLFAHAEGWQWTPDLIWFNNLEAYGTPNYYVQKLFSTNPGTHLLELTENDEELIGQDSLYASAVKNVETNELVLKLVNSSINRKTISLNVNDSKLDNNAKMYVLQSDNLKGLNSFTSPENIAPVTEEITISADQLEVELKPKSLNVIRVKIVE